MRLVLALALTLALAGAARAADVPVSGVVVDAAGQPVEYATVNAPAVRRGAVTDDACFRYIESIH